MVLMDQSTGKEIGRTDGVNWMQADISAGQTQHIQSLRGMPAQIKGPATKIGIVENFSATAGDTAEIERLTEANRLLQSNLADARREVDLTVSRMVHMRELVAALVHINGDAITLTSDDIKGATGNFKETSSKINDGTLVITLEITKDSPF